MGNTPANSGITLHLTEKEIVLHYAYKIRLKIGYSTKFPHRYEGLKLWDSNIILARFIVINSALFKDKSVLQLGSGTGIGGISVKKFTNASHITFTDLSDEVVGNIRNNCKKNSIPDVEKIIAFRMEWKQYESFKKKYDIVIVSDPFFHHCTPENLYSIMLNFLKLGGSIIIAAPSSPAMLTFLRIVQVHKFKISKLRLDNTEYLNSPLFNLVEGEQEFPLISKGQIQIHQFIRIDDSSDFSPTVIRSKKVSESMKKMKQHQDIEQKELKLIKEEEPQPTLPKETGNAIVQGNQTKKIEKKDESQKRADPVAEQNNKIETSTLQTQQKNEQENISAGQKQITVQVHESVFAQSSGQKNQSKELIQTPQHTQQAHSATDNNEKQEQIVQARQEIKGMEQGDLQKNQQKQQKSTQKETQTKIQQEIDQKGGEGVGEEDKTQEQISSIVTLQQIQQQRQNQVQQKQKQQSQIAELVAQEEVPAESEPQLQNGTAQSQDREVVQSEGKIEKQEPAPTNADQNNFECREQDNKNQQGSGENGKNEAESCQSPKTSALPQDNAEKMMADKSLQNCLESKKEQENQEQTIAQKVEESPAGGEEAQQKEGDYKNQGDEKKEERGKTDEEEQEIERKEKKKKKNKRKKKN